MEDLTGEGSRRVLERMHELEMVTRAQCNSLLRILHDKSASIDEKYKSCEILVIEAEAKCSNMEMALHRRGDRERKETTDVHNEPRAAISAIDQQASLAVVELDKKVECATNQILALDATVNEVHGLCERAEVAAARAQEYACIVRHRQQDDWMTSAELKEVAIARARSLQSPDGQPIQLARCIRLAQKAASRSPRRQRAFSPDQAGCGLMSSGHRPLAAGLPRIDLP